MSPPSKGPNGKDWRADACKSAAALRIYLSVREPHPQLVLIRQDWLYADRPLDGERRIVPNQAAFVFRHVMGGGFVDEVGTFGEHDKAMGEAGRDPDLAVVFSAHLGAYPARESRRRFSKVNGDIEDAPIDDANKFPLALAQLIVEAAENVAPRARMVVLHKNRIETDGAAKLFRVPAFHVEAPFVLEHLRLADQDLGNRRPSHLHNAAGPSASKYQSRYLKRSPFAQWPHRRRM